MFRATLIFENLRGALNLSPLYGHVILVHGYFVLTGAYKPYHGCPILNMHAAKKGCDGVNWSMFAMLRDVFVDRKTCPDCAGKIAKQGSKKWQKNAQIVLDFCKKCLNLRFLLLLLFPSRCLYIFLVLSNF